MFTDKIPIIRSRMRLLSSAAHIAKIKFMDPDTLEYRRIYRPLFLALKQNVEKHYVGISLDNPGKVAFSSGVHKYDRKRRTRTTLQRYFSRRHKKLYERMGEYWVNEFCCKVISHATPVLDRFTILRGLDIVRAFQHTLGGDSCMTGDDCDKTEVYAENSNVALLTYSDEKMEGRALLWETREGKQVLDRIYPNSGYHIDHYREYCKKHDILQRNHNGLPRGSELGGYHSVHLDEAYNGLWPFMDTFRFADDNSGGIILNNRGGPYLLNDTCGGIDECEICADCNDIIEGEACGMEHGDICEECRSNYFYCESCEIDHSCDDTDPNEVIITRRCGYSGRQVTDYLTYCTECYNEYQETQKNTEDED